LRKIKKVDLFFVGVGGGRKNMVDPGRKNCKYGPEHLLTDDMLEVELDTFDAGLPNSAEVWRDRRVEMSRAG